MKRPAFIGRAQHALTGLHDDTRSLGIPIPLREIDGNLTLTRSTVQAWYVLRPDRWSFLSPVDQQAVLDAKMNAWAGLSGRDWHLRRSPRPAPIAQWAARYDAANPDPLDSALWAEHLQRTQRHLQRRPRLTPITYLGVEVAPRSLLAKIGSTTWHGSREAQNLQAALRTVDESCGALGRPATTEEIAWLVHSSVALGIPTPPYLGDGQPYTAEDILGFTEGVTVHPQPGRRAMRVEAHRVLDGEPEQRYVTTLAIGRVEDLHVPGRDYPWMAYGDRLPFPVEWSVHGRVSTPAEALRGVQRKLNQVRDQRAQYNQHPDIDVPPDLELVEGKARETRLELTEGDPVLTARVPATVTVAICGRTEQETLDRAEQFRLHYRTQRMQAPAVAAVAANAASFVPGAKRATKAHTRNMKMGYWAAALPTARAELGDGKGMFLGHTSGTSKQPVFWDRHAGMYEGESSGLTPVIAGLGGGKSTLLADIADEGASSGGEEWTLLDPSGPLGNIVTLPQYRGGRGRLIDLLSSNPGSLSPYAVVPVPKRANYPDEAKYQEALTNAAMSRKALAMDLLLGSMSPQAVAMQGTEILLGKALRQVGGEPGGSLRQVADALGKMDNEVGRELRDHLYDLAENLRMRLYWEAGDVSLSEQCALLVIAMPGVTLPDMTVDPVRWSVEDRLAVPLTLAASYLTTRRLYDRPMDEPKGVGFDESHTLQTQPSGKALVSRLDRDSRKWRQRVLLGSHNFTDNMGEGVINRINEAFVGHTEDPDAQEGALRVLRVSRGVGYEATLATLSPVDPTTGERPPWRQFVMRDASGRVERFRSDMAHKPELMAAISPKKRPVRERVTGGLLLTKDPVSV